MSAKELKTTAELEQLALEIVRRMQGCDHVETVTIASDPQKGWFISACAPGRADDGDVRRALLIAEADLADRYDLARRDDNVG